MKKKNNFLRTLDLGLKKMDLLLNEKKNIDGKTAFELYDTYGFPLDLTRLIASENGIRVDEEGFEKEMLQQKNRSRAAAQVDTEDWIIVNEPGVSEFSGYTEYETESRVIKYRRTQSQGKELFQVVLNKTPFYAESGGQVGDTGHLIFDDEKIEVINTKKENDLILHFIKKLPSKVDQSLTARINKERRGLITIHHSATHLMHAALRKVLGTHVAQKGSLVNEQNLRFDFSHFAKVSDEELANIETLVNEKIRQNIPVVIKEMDKDEALATGAMALFGEKYGDTVRVVIMDPGYSIELCGGTHVGHTGELGYFKITLETAVGAGVRRMEALSGAPAEQLITQEFLLNQKLREILKNPKDPQKAIEALQSENALLKKQLDKMEDRQLEILKTEILPQFESIDGIMFLGKTVEVSNAEALKKLGLLFKGNFERYLVVLVADIEGKANVVVMLDEKTVAEKNIDAPKIIKEHIASRIKGGGGGQKTFASAGGQDVSLLKEVISNVKALL